MGSNGSVIPFFFKKKKEGVIPITDKNMTRFNITLMVGVNMVLFSLEKSWGGELFVPKIHSYKILDIAKAIAPECKLKFIGIRPGEKIHEEMITYSDSHYTYDIGKYYVILPFDPGVMTNLLINLMQKRLTKDLVIIRFKHRMGKL